MTDIFDEMLADQGGATATATAEPTTEPTATPAEPVDTNASEWPKTVTLPVGETPEGAVSVADFAKLVNEQVVKDRVAELLAQDMAPQDAVVEALAATVNQASFYQAVKGQRNALPHYIVKYEVPVLDADGKETGETKTEEKTFVPVEIGKDWWKNRPTRGGGGAPRSEEDVAKRLVRAGKKAANLKAAEARLAKLESNVKAMREQVAKYTEWLTADGKTIDEAIAAHEAEVEKEEASNAIPDDGEQQ